MAHFNLDGPSLDQRPASKWCGQGSYLKGDLDFEIGLGFARTLLQTMDTPVVVAGFQTSVHRSAGEHILKRWEPQLVTCMGGSMDRWLACVCFGRHTEHFFGREEHAPENGTIAASLVGNLKHWGSMQAQQMWSGHACALILSPVEADQVACLTDSLPAKRRSGAGWAGHVTLFGAKSVLNNSKPQVVLSGGEIHGRLSWLRSDGTLLKSGHA
jgi:hypothetical protein